MRLTVEILVQKPQDAEMFERAALKAATELHKSMPEIIQGEPSIEYTMITKDGALLTISVPLTDYSRQNEIRDRILKETFHAVK
jgi:hypothetical protein